MTTTPGRVVALAGIDGSGKTSTIEALGRDPRFRHVAFTKKTNREDVHRIWRLSGADPLDPETNRSGDVARALRYGYAFDFLRYYEETVLPVLAAGGLVISDRWSYCNLAYAYAGAGVGDQVRDVLRLIPPPDLLIYLEISPEEARRRILARGNPLGDESLALLRDYHDGYEVVLRDVPCRIERVRNDDQRATIERVMELAYEVLMPSYSEALTVGGQR